MTGKPPKDPFDDFADEQAIAWSYRDFIGEPEPVAHYGPMRYEPRGAWTCATCRTIYVGVKSGELYEIPAEGDEVGKHFKAAGGIQAVEGWPCGKTEHGAHHDLVFADDDGKLYIGDHAEATGFREVDLEAKMLSLGLVRQPEQDGQKRRWILAGTANGRLVLVPFAPGGRVLPLVTDIENVRWIEGGHSSMITDRDDVWLLVSTDGALTRLRLGWDRHGTPTASRFGLGFLQDAPTCVALDQHHDITIRSLFYGTASGLHVAVLGPDSIRSDVKLEDFGRVHHIRRATVHRTPHVIVCAEGGRVISSVCEHPEGASSYTWHAWQKLPADVLYLQITREYRTKEEDQERPQPSFHEATLLLRNHRIYRVPLYNAQLVGRKLRSKRWKPLTPERNVPDDECRARVFSQKETWDVETIKRLASLGAEKTLETICRKLGRAPTTDHVSAIGIGAAVLTASARLPDANARSIAAHLHAALLRFLRGARDEARGSDERQALERWIVFVGKYFLRGHTFAQKRERLESLVEINEKQHRPVDALIYETRLCHQGFDVLWEEIIPTPAMAATAIDDDIALSFGDGRLARLAINGADDDHDVYFEIGPPSLPAPTADEDRVFGNYSRIIATTDEGRLIAARRLIHALDDTLVDSRAVEPPWPQVDRVDLGAEHQHQVYSIWRLDDGRFLLGLRDLSEPLAIWNVNKNDVTPIKPIWGTDFHVRTAIAGGQRRVWAIVGLDDRGTLALGAEDGYLRCGRVDGDTLEDVDLGSEFLGSAIRCLTVVKAPRKSGEAVAGQAYRRFLFAGTEQGGLFCYEIFCDRDGAATELRLKFRDLLLHPVENVFAMKISGEDEVLCALDRSGRMTTFDLPRVRESESRYLGRRPGDYQLTDEASLALPTADGKYLLVAGWKEETREGRLTLVRFRNVKRDTFREKRDDDGLLHAALADTRRHVNDEDTALAILAAVPLGIAALRWRLARHRLAGASPEDWKQRLQELRDQALATSERGVDEIDAILDAAVADITDVTTGREHRQQRLEAFQDLVVTQSNRNPWFRDPGLQETVVRRLLTLGMIRIWDKEKLYPWVDRHLQHPVPQVHVATLRALSVALHELLTRTRPEDRESALRDVFPAKDHEPPVTGATWLLDSLVRFLLAHPSMGSSSECTANTWAAVSVLVNLLRLMPDSALIIFDHISIKGVDPLVFGVLGQRLNKLGADKPILEKLELYVPWTTEPKINQVVEHCDKVVSEAAKAADDMKDGSYLMAFGRVYEHFRELADVKIRDDINKAGAQKIRVEPPPAWVGKRRPKPFFFYTMSWLDTNLAPILQTLQRPGATIQDHETKINDCLERLDNSHRSGPSDSLFWPEVGVVRSILRHWLYVLRDPPPAPGSPFTPYTLGERLPNARSVFEVKDHPGLLIRAEPFGGTLAAPIPEVWDKIKTEQRQCSRIVWIEEVITRQSNVAMVMDRIDGMNLHDYYDQHWRKSERFDLAWRVMIDIADALDELREMQIVHRDVSWKNIMWDSVHDRFLLVDLGHASRREHLDETSAPAARYLVHSIRSYLGGLDGITHLDRDHAYDSAVLLQIVIALMLEPKVDSDVREKHGLEPYNIPRALTNGVPVRHLDWCQSLKKRWSRPDTKSWTANNLLDEAVGLGRGVFLSGVTEETKAERESLLASPPTLTTWHVQGRWTNQGRQTVDQIRRLIHGSRVFVLFLGNASGATPPEVPDDVRRHAEEKVGGWPRGMTPSYTQTELIIARILGKSIVVLDVREWEPTAPADERQRAVQALATDHGPVKVTREDFAQKLLRALEEV